MVLEEREVADPGDYLPQPFQAKKQQHICTQDLVFPAFIFAGAVQEEPDIQASTVFPLLSEIAALCIPLHLYFM